MLKQPMNRRSFLQWSGLALLAPVFLSRTASAEERRRGGSAPAAGGAAELNWPLVVPGKDTAVAVNYVEKHADVKKAELKIDRQGVKFAEQKCVSCTFYKGVGKKNGKDAGTCQIFPNKLVMGDAWCTSWNKKA